MKQGKVVIILFAITLFLSSCGDFLLNDEFKGGDWFYLENAGAIMPVWVKGNKSSNTFVIFLHGGPGDTAMTVEPAFKTLEKDYAFVYYDQRGSGIAQGNAKPESFTIEQFVEDLLKLVHLIRHKYNNPTLFLMGHSWGGALGTAYLVDAQNQQYISGWIEIDGASNFKVGLERSVDWVTNKAKEKIEAGEDVKHWKKELGWYGKSVVFDNYKVISRHVSNVDKLNGYVFDPSKKPHYGISDYLNSPLSLSVYLNSFNMLSNHNLNLNEFNLTPEMHKITVPSLVLWGNHDGILPVELAYNSYNNLGTHTNDKYLNIFEYSAHSPQLEEPELFVEKVKEFVEKYK
ncbi:MAG: alpha/beta fold hydrolase [Cystobacterineae bacterium]|nr:alpha/beta fold hydrolase [Cystobacterineae bacterium]